MVTGHSTVDALRILHHELQQQLQQHQSRGRVKVDWIRFLHHGNAYSLLHWTSVTVIIICCLLLIIAFAAEENRYTNLTSTIAKLHSCSVIHLQFRGHFQTCA